MFQLSSVQSLSRVRLFATPWTAARQATLSINNSRSLPNSCSLSRLCHPTISSSVTPFSSCLQSSPASGSFPMSQFFASGGPKYWSLSLSFSIRSSNEYSGLISLRMAWLDLLAFQGTLKSLLQHRGSRASSGGTSSLMQIHMCTRFASVSRSVIKEYEVE